MITRIEHFIPTSCIRRSNEVGRMEVVSWWRYAASKRHGATHAAGLLLRTNKRSLSLNEGIIVGKECNTLIRPTIWRTKKAASFSRAVRKFQDWRAANPAQSYHLLRHQSHLTASVEHWESMDGDKHVSNNESILLTNLQSSDLGKSLNYRITQSLEVPSEILKH